MTSKKPQFQVGRKRPPEPAAATFEDRQEQRARGAVPQGEDSAARIAPDSATQMRDSASSESRPLATSQAREPAALRSRDVVESQAERAASAHSETVIPRRGRGGWTKADPYTRKDGVPTRSTTIYLPVELAERLRRFAFEADRKQSDVVVEALERLLAADIAR